jgi:hypothetical protein
MFQVLKFEHGEIRHSNVLAWILDPAENHGLGDSFLKKWLMRLMHESSGEVRAPLSAVDIDGWQLQNVEVRREWQHIDLLVCLTLTGGQQWVICIENKIGTTQHSSQLQRYRETVEKEFPTATGRVYLFLTKDEEAPEDAAYLSASYTQVHRALKDCLNSRSHSVGAEPSVLLENYLRLLEEKFMEESEIARTALRIYQQHRRALDVIFEHKPDNVRRTSDLIRQKLQESAEELGIVVVSYNKNYVRFIPKEWSQIGNMQGNAWSGTKATVVFELNITQKKARFFVIAGDPPSLWINQIWELSSKAPFTRGSRTKKPKKWFGLHNFGDIAVNLEDYAGDEPGDAADKIFQQVQASLHTPATKQIVDLIAAKLPMLEPITFAQS